MRYKYFNWVIVIILLWWVTRSLYLGVTTPPNEGDSLIIHIPAAQRIIERTIFNLDYTKDLFYPSAIELILALFILLKIPLGLFNVVGIIIFFVGSYLLGCALFKDEKYSLAFAANVALLHGIIRWSLTQKPDIWMMAVLSFVLWIVFKKKRGDLDYFLLGLFSAFFVGAKFNAPIFLVIIILPFYKIITRKLSFKKLFLFLIPFVLIGLSWYVRNIVIAGDPFYFPDYIRLSSHFLLSNYTIYGYIFQPMKMLDAYISEFLVWTFGLIVVPLYLYTNRKNLKKQKNYLAAKFFVSAIILIFISFTFPYRPFLHQMIGTSRYILPAIYLIIICIFLIFKERKKEDLLVVSSIPVLIISQIPDYHPKIIFPIIIFIWAYYFRKRLVKFILKLKFI